jgi:hypothetical protein
MLGFRLPHDREDFVENIVIEGHDVICGAIRIVFACSLLRVRSLSLRFNFPPTSFDWPPAMSDAAIQQLTGGHPPTLASYQCDAQVDWLTDRVIQQFKSSLKKISLVTNGLGAYRTTVESLSALDPSCEVKLFLNTLHKFRYARLCEQECNLIREQVKNLACLTTVQCDICRGDTERL